MSKEPLEFLKHIADECAVIFNGLNRCFLKIRCEFTACRQGFSPEPQLCWLPTSVGWPFGRYAGILAGANIFLTPLLK